MGQVLVEALVLEGVEDEEGGVEGEGVEGREALTAQAGVGVEVGCAYDAGKVDEGGQVFSHNGMEYYGHI